MSRLTASPFHKPSPFVFPREPISPPETLTDSGYPSTMGLPPPTANEPRHEENTPFTNFEAPSHSRNSRPSISYQNSGFRENSNRPVHRNYRFFVVVIPPSRLIQEHGQLGHTLASGPPHRLSQGIIMPLFPTMYGQLTAIAKEFNFPSTTGLCLYLHVNESGVVMTPRISDESWHMLWNHLFDMPTVARGPPIGGKIEFDIDFQQARWYSSWLSTLGRDHFERPISRVPSTAPSFIPIHGENRDSINEDDSPDFDKIDTHLLHSRGAPSGTRHVPRKLSLVDRFDTPISRSDGKAGTIQGPESPGHGLSISKALSPIAQEEEPQSARDQLDDRVRSWRASAIVKPTSLAGRGQTSLEPINLPNNVSLGEGSSISPGTELNLEDFTWSISSAGPADYDVMSIETLSQRLPSPDIARRMFDDSPPTPSTVTSWGAPLCYPPSPLSDFRPPSVDLGSRNVFSPPLTPTTATSWGPISPAVSVYGWHQEIYRPESVHLGDRGEFSRPVTPSTATSWGAPLSYPPTPITPYRVSTPDAAQRTFDYVQENGTPALQSYSRLPVGNPWKLMWPYLKTREVPDLVVQISGYPHFSIYPPIYPHFDLYPAAAASRPQQTRDACVQNPIYAAVHPLKVDVTYPEVYTGKEGSGPIFIAVSQYPQFDLYPTVQRHAQQAPFVPFTCHGCRYPVFDIYPVVYPHFNLYPTVEYSLPEETNVISYGVYPNLVIYPAVYPYFDIYPSKAAETLEEQVGSKLKDIDVNHSSHYPSFNIYPVAYSNFNIYPASLATSERKSIRRPPIKVSASQYPVFNLYPSVYPHLSIYPPKAGGSVRTLGDVHSVSKATVHSDSYPVIRPYPPVYPHFELYPSATSGMADVITTKELPVLLSGGTAYPTFNLYPPVYPHFSLYPPNAASVGAIAPKATPSYPYPFLQIYAPLYPHLNIYPPIAASQLMQPPVQNPDENITIDAVKRQVIKSRKSHKELQQEIFRCGPVRTPSGTGAGIHPELDLRSLSIASRRDNRRIVATRSPTGPALHRPAAPPALPSPGRKLPIPPSMNGGPRSPNILEQMAGYKAETSPVRRYSPVARSTPRTAVTATQRASMILPLRHMPLPRSTESLLHLDDTFETPGTASSGLNRARSVGGNGGRTNGVRPRVRESFIVPRTPSL